MNLWLPAAEKAPKTDEDSYHKAQKALKSEDEQFFSPEEIDKMLPLHLHRMFGMVRDLLHTTNDNDFNKLFSRIEKYENISDNMEVEIANYLNQVSDGRLSSESKLQIRAMLREVTEIESIGDSCYNLARTINRKHRSDMDLREGLLQGLERIKTLRDVCINEIV